MFCYFDLPEYYPDVYKAKGPQSFQSTTDETVSFIWCDMETGTTTRAPHFHLLVWGVHQVDLFSWVVNNWYEIAGNGDVNHFRFHAGLIPGTQKCVQRSGLGVVCGPMPLNTSEKTFEVAEWGNLWTGRFWGVLARGEYTVWRGSRNRGSLP